MIYLDTSVLYDFYVKGVRTKEVQRFVRERQHDLAISPWCEVEFCGALGRRVRDGRLPAALAERAAKRFEHHRSQGLYRRYGLEPHHLLLAAALTRRFNLGIKAPDALHLAVVQGEGCDLVTSDGGMAAAAGSLALTAILIES